MVSAILAMGSCAASVCARSCRRLRDVIVGPDPGAPSRCQRDSREGWDDSSRWRDLPIRCRRRRRSAPTTGSIASDSRGGGGAFRSEGPPRCRGRSSPQWRPRQNFDAISSAGICGCASHADLPANADDQKSCLPQSPHVDTDEPMVRTSDWLVTIDRGDGEIVTQGH